MTHLESEVSMTKGTHTFNWHDEPDSFLGRALTEMIPADMDWAKAEEATDGWKRVALTVTASGIPLDAEKFMNRLDSSIDREVERRLVDRLRGAAEIDRLLEDLHRLQESVTEHAFRMAREMGIEVFPD